MTLLDFITTRMIVESENDYLIDASSELMDENSMKDWVEEFLYPLLPDDDIKHISTYDFPNDEKIMLCLKARNYYYASRIVIAALKSNFRVPTEDYYINDDGDFHLIVPKRYIK
jgi:hypothetical protein